MGNFLHISLLVCTPDFVIITQYHPLESALHTYATVIAIFTSVVYTEWVFIRIYGPAFIEGIVFSYVIASTYTSTC